LFLIVFLRLTCLTFQRLTRLEIVNPVKFLSQLRVFFNTKRVLEMLNEREVKVTVSADKNRSRMTAKVIGGLSGSISEIIITKLGLNDREHGEPRILEKLKEFRGGVRIEDLTMRFPPIEENIYPDQHIFLVDVYVNVNLPSEFKELFKSFLLSYRDVGALWDHIV